MPRNMKPKPKKTVRRMGGGKMKTKGYAGGGKMKTKGYAGGGKMKTKMMKRGGAAAMTLAQVRAAAKKKGYKLVKV